MSMVCGVFIVPDAAVREVLIDPTEIHELLDSLYQTNSDLSLEKSWHGLHYVLTGTAFEGDPPLNFIAGGGIPVGEEDVGYGPARALDPAEVVEIDKALAAVTDEEFRRRFDLTEMTSEEIYPQIWDEPLEELLDEYLDYFHQLQQHVHQAAETGQALVIAIQ